ncbi:MAG TPA: vWA domain-containing protein [Myxococcota bacterium]|nr:vWA domain-containing protein [Myxococcota bacterium]
MTTLHMLFPALLLLAGASAAATPLPDTAQRPRIEVAFVLDTTGSMSGLIDGAKRKIWQVANQLASGKPTPEIRMALVGYRDRGDAYVTRVRDLTADLDAIYAELQAFQADGGGDGPESVNQALHEARTKLSWSRDPNVYRAIFLVGDAPPHMDYAQDVVYAQSVRAARKAGIVINTIQCGSEQDTTPIWQEIAELGAGRYVAIRQDGGMLAVDAPQDAELARLNRALADTVIAWGNASEQAELVRKREVALEAPAPSAAARLAYLAKSGGRVNAGREDLVDAVKEGRIDVNKVKKSELPASLQALSPAEREKQVKAKVEERAKLQAQVAELSRERDTWLQKEEARLAAAGKGDGFDQQVLEAIRTQAASAGIAY